MEKESCVWVVEGQLCWGREIDDGDDRVHGLGNFEGIAQQGHPGVSHSNFPGRGCGHRVTVLRRGIVRRAHAENTTPRICHGRSGIRVRECRRGLCGICGSTVSEENSRYQGRRAAFTPLACVWMHLAGAVFLKRKPVSGRCLRCRAEPACEDGGMAIYLVATEGRMVSCRLQRPRIHSKRECGVLVFCWYGGAGALQPLRLP